jgi:hypothetical protein
MAIFASSLIKTSKESTSWPKESKNKAPRASSKTGFGAPRSKPEKIRISLLLKKLNERRDMENFVTAHTARGRPHAYLVRSGQEQTALNEGRNDDVALQGVIRITGPVPLAAASWQADAIAGARRS